MQAIGTRAHCACRVDLPMHLPAAGTKGTLNPYQCACGGPWLVVEDFTDIPARTAEHGQVWVVGKAGQSIGQAVRVDWNEQHHGIASVMAWCHQQGYTWPWATRHTVGRVPWEELDGHSQSEMATGTPEVGSWKEC